LFILYVNYSFFPFQKKNLFVLNCFLPILILFLFPLISGMRKDPDGFMDIEWCGTKVLHTWNDLREEFKIANGRKAIAPTQVGVVWCGVVC
jgi:hypothetical protein